MLDERREAFCSRIVARLLHKGCRCRIFGRVFDMENGLVLLDEWLIEVAFVVLDALLVDAPLRHINNPFENLAAVLQAVRKASIVSRLRQELDIIYAVVFSKVEPSGVLVAVDIVRIHAIATFEDSELDSLLHDLSHGGIGGVKPPLAGPAVQLLA